MSDPAVVADAIGSTGTQPPRGGSDREDPAEAFAWFVRTRSAALLRTAFLLTGDQHLAEDLVQSALVRTHRAWRRLHETDHAEAYTRRAMHHLHISWWRRSRVAESLSGETPEPRARGADEPDRVDTRLALYAALRKLTSRQRAVLVLRYFDDFSELQTAEVLGVSVGTVKSQTSKALDRLRAVAPELAERYVPGGNR